MSRGGRILLAEDDADLAAALCETLADAGYVVDRASDGGEALKILEDGATDPDLILSDARMRPVDGYALLDRVVQSYPRIPVVMMTAYGTVSDAVSALRAGARDYLEKPFEARKLLDKVRQHARISPSAGLIAESAAMGRLVDLARRVAPTDVSVMLTGPSGSGKEVMARFIHRVSNRADGPFIAINCAAIPESLLEATLMGHEKGAFTGAVKASPGKFEQANGGTILLDEITEMPAALQAKLLRVIQEREVERVGGNRRIPLDVRIVATSNRDLQVAIAEGVLREDLYYRLNVFPLALPPLADRPEDVLPLAESILARYHDVYGKGPSGIDAAARAALQAHDWPGNVRELQNVVQRAAVLAGDGFISATHLGLITGEPKAEATPNRTEIRNPGLGAALRRHEWERIAAALRAAGGIRAEAARQLGISPRTLRHKLKQFRDAGQPVLES